VIQNANGNLARLSFLVRLFDRNRIIKNSDRTPKIDVMFIQVFQTFIRIPFKLVTEGEGMDVHFCKFPIL